MSDELVRRFQDGQIVIFPTDTLYGVGCSVNSTAAVKRLYQIKQREADKPTLILVPSLKQARKYGVFNKKAQEFAEKFWPGPLTIVVKATEKTPTEIQGLNQTIAIRVPDQPFLLEILTKLDEAILAPSANFSGEAAPSTFSEIDTKLLSLVDYAIDLAQVSGKARSSLPSTIVDLSRDKLEVIREGAIEKSRLTEAFESARRS